MRIMPAVPELLHVRIEWTVVLAQFGKHRARAPSDKGGHRRGGRNT
jgi:hypothetical protein